MTTSKTVSYTHLDVYKRQHRARMKRIEDHIYRLQLRIRFCIIGEDIVLHTDVLEITVVTVEKKIVSGKKQIHKPGGCNTCLLYTSSV